MTHPPAKASPPSSTAARPGGSVREFVSSDVPEVAGLYMRAYARTSDPPTQGLCDYFQRVFSSDPWMELDVSPSLVFVDDAGAVRGFIGAHPRRFICGDRVITAVMMGQLMVDPSMQRRGIAWELGSTIMAGPQALTYGTTASVPAANMWCRLGFWNPPFAGLKWNKRLRSAGATSGGGDWKSPIRAAVRRLSTLARRVPHPFQGWGTEPCQSVPRPKKGRGTRVFPCRPMLGPQELCDLGHSLLDRFTMRPDLDTQHATWLWGMLADSPRKGRLQTCVVECEDEERVGWLVYLLNDDGMARILETAHAPGRCSEVLAAFFRHAAETGCVRVRGDCTNPELTAGVVELGARLSVVDSGCVFHSEQADVRSTLLNGEVFLSELDSESWFSFADR